MRQREDKLIQAKIWLKKIRKLDRVCLKMINQGELRAPLLLKRISRK